MFGIDPADMPAFLGPRRLMAGRLPQQGQELLIDQRLAVAGGYKVGDTVGALGRDWRIVGVVEPGVAARVFCPIQALRQIRFDGEARVTAFYVKLRPGAGKDPIERDRIAMVIADALKARVDPLDAIQQMWASAFATMYAYIWVASAVAMTVCFLLICVTMYTMVVERTSQIAIIKAMGGGRLMLLAQSVLEAAILSVAGTVGGLVLTMLARWVIQRTMPLLTVEVRAKWFLLAIVVGIVGGTLSALYPGWRAGRVQPAVALQNM
jgi:putative ABC transport system permease protein